MMFAMHGVYWGWVVCFNFLVLFTISAGVAFSFNEIMVPFNEEIHTSTTLLSWLGSMPVSLPMLGAPFGNWMFERFGCQKTVVLGVFILTIALSLTALVRNITQMIFAYGLLASLGILFIVQPPFFLLDVYFPYSHPRHVLATSIIACGFPLATLIFNPVTYTLMDALGWRITYSIYAILTLVVGVLTSLTFRSHEASPDEEVTILGPDEDDTIEIEKYNTDSKRKVQISKRTEIILSSLWFIASTLKCMGYYTPFVTLVKQLDVLGIPQAQAANAMAVIGACEVVSRAVTSYFGDYIKGKMLWMYVACTLALCLQNALGSLATDYVELVIYAAALGIFGGPVIAAMYSSCSEVMCGHKVPALFSLFRVGLGVGSLAGPTIAGAMFDLTNSFHNVFYINSAVYFLASATYFLIIQINRLKPKWCFPDVPEEIALSNGTNKTHDHNTFKSPVTNSTSENKEVNNGDVMNPLFNVTRNNNDLSR